MIDEREEAKIRLRQFISLPCLPVCLCLFSGEWGEVAPIMQGSIYSLKSLNKYVGIVKELILAWKIVPNILVKKAGE